MRPGLRGLAASRCPDTPVRPWPWGGLRPECKGGDGANGHQRSTLRLTSLCAADAAASPAAPPAGRPGLAGCRKTRARPAQASPLGAEAAKPSSWQSLIWVRGAGRVRREPSAGAHQGRKAAGAEWRSREVAGGTAVPAHQGGLQPRVALGAWHGTSSSEEPSRSESVKAET